jgi:SAM-dependent methyltransferase
MRCGLGSGLGWLAYRLALRGHEIAAVDLVTNDFDGLGAHRHYDRAFLSLQAEFDRLPFVDRSVDLVVYNAAFHYAADYLITLQEGFRVLDAGGQVVIMDSPLYHERSSGTAMVRERESALAKRHSFHGRALDAESFLTYDRLDVLEAQLGVRWTFFQPWYGLRWWSRPWIARVRGAREPAQFKLIVGRRVDPS